MLEADESGYVRMTSAIDGNDCLWTDSGSSGRRCSAWERMPGILEGAGGWL